jgi:hypothetical protein
MKLMRAHTLVFALAALLNSIFPQVSVADTDLINLNITPARADDMVEFVGLGVTGFGNNNKSPGSMTQRTWTQTLLTDLGIRHIRNGIGWMGLTANSSLDTPDVEDVVVAPELDDAAQRNWTTTFYNSYGIRTLMGIGGISYWLVPDGRIQYPLIDDQLNSIKNNYNTRSNAIMAVEMQNEFPITVPNSATGIPAPNLYNYTVAVHNRWMIPNRPLVMPSLKDFQNGISGFNTVHWRYRYWPYQQSGSGIQPWVNYANLHHYPNLWTATATENYTPSTGLSACLSNIFNNDVQTQRTVMVTEVGTHSKTHQNTNPDTNVTTTIYGSEWAQAADINRYACELFNYYKSSPRIAERMYYFSLFGEWHNADPKGWGIANVTYSGGVPASYVKRPSFNALKGFLNIFREKSWNTTSKVWAGGGTYTSTNLNLDLLGVGDKTKYIVFKKATNEYLIAFWQDTPALNRATGANLVPAWDAVTVRLRGRSSGTFTLHYPNGSNAWNYQTGAISYTASGGNVTLAPVNVGNWVSVISIKP